MRHLIDSVLSAWSNPASRDKHDPRHTITATVFLLSGFSALIYQVVWQRVLTQEIGADSISVAFIVAIFMIGLGVGSLAGGLFVKHIKRGHVIAYIAIEVLIGIIGLISIPMLRWANTTKPFGTYESISADFITNCAVLFIPTFLMGATSPIIMEMMKGSIQNWGQVVGRFYGINILGAALGSVAGGLFFIELFGLQGTTVLAALLNFLIAIIFLIGTRAGLYHSPAPTLIAPPPAHDTLPLRSLAPLLVATLFFGFATLSLQMIFFRILANYYTLSTAVFPIILSAFLVLMAAGQSISGSIVDRIPDRLRGQYLLALFLATAAFTAFSVLLPPAATIPLGAMVFTPSVEDWKLGYGALYGVPNIIIAFLFSCIIMLPVFFASGYFPAVVRIATARIEDAGYTFGIVLFGFTVGNIFGAYLTGIYLFELFGTKGALVFTLALLLIGMLGLGYSGLIGSSFNGRMAGLAIGALATFILVAPRDYYKSFALGRYSPTEIVEGRLGVLSIVPADKTYYRLDMFRTESAAVLVKDPDDGLNGWNMSELFAIDPAFRPKKILIIGMGHGYLARALLDYPFVESITVVELSPEVVSTVKKLSAPEIAVIFGHPKVRIETADGRRFVQHAARTGAKYDLIQINVNNPWRTGASSLYTKEFMATLKSIIAEDGYLATRAMIGYVTAGLNSFDRALWPGRAHVFFGNRTATIQTPIRVPADLRHFYLAQNTRNQTEIKSMQKLDPIKMVQFNKSYRDGYRTNSDDHPIFEYRYLEDRLQRYKDPKRFMSTMDFKEQTELMAVEPGF